MFMAEDCTPLTPSGGCDIVGWKVKDKNGTVIYTYTDLNDKSDGIYFTIVTLDTDITDTTTVAASTVTGLTLSDVVIGETLIYDGDGTVGRVLAVTGSDLTVETITVSGSGDASSYVYKTTGTLDTTVDNTANLAPGNSTCVYTDTGGSGIKYRLPVQLWCRTGRNKQHYCRHLGDIQKGMKNGNIR